MYEIVRAQIITGLNNFLSSDVISQVLSVIDHAMERYEVKDKCTDIITTENYLDTIKYYVATKSIENLSKNTLNNYFYTLKNFMDSFKCQPSQISSTNIHVYLDNYKKTRKVSGCSLNNMRVIIKNYFEWLVEMDIIKTNPCTHIKPIKYKDNTRQPISLIDLEKIRNACITLRETAIIEMLYSTAARVSELINMKISDIDFIEKTVVIPHGKGDKRRISYLNAKAILSLKNYLETRTDNCEYLFVNEKGSDKHKINKKTIERAIKVIVERTDVTAKVSPHVFRTTSGTNALHSGMPIEQVQKFLGHAKIQTTLRYAKINDDDVKQSHRKYFG